MYKHHQESIENMIDHYSQNPEVIALCLVGSVANGTEHPDSDLDGVAVISREYFEEKKKTCDEHESVWGKCTIKIYKATEINIDDMTCIFNDSIKIFPSNIRRDSDRNQLSDVFYSNNVFIVERMKL